MIYLDNASTSFPKPEVMLPAISNYLQNFAVSPGRGAYRLAEQAENIVDETRQMLADLLGVKNKKYMVICSNATHALNIVIRGGLLAGDHVLVCDYSHNSALRPLESLARTGVITYDVFHIDENGDVNIEDFESKIKPNTKMLVLNHASNVIGVKATVSLMTAICKKHNILCLLDVTQSIIYENINVNELNVDFVAGTGHKSLLGPTGCGFLYVKNPNHLTPLMEGGSIGLGSIGQVHPRILPHKFEAGTLNMLSIVGLHSSLSYIESKGGRNIARHALQLTSYLWDSFSQLCEVRLYGTDDFSKKVPVISFTVDGVLTNELAYKYDKNYQICVRGGLQCAPLVHKHLKTFPSGTIRVSPGFFNTKEQMDEFIKATKEIIHEVRHVKTCA